MDLFPDARRVLLTAYADTDAAIHAINVVDLDHYLLKPWDPPEEKLYPVVDELLDRVARAGPAGVEGLTLVGHRWSAQSSGGQRLPRPQPGALPLDVRSDDAQAPAGRGAAAARGRRCRW